ncbi:MAG: hypothetical protein IK138_01990 [Lachnospiraceae bacterium]|nr:hypothetical protein [Lachnospiraceae bacterium]
MSFKLSSKGKIILVFSGIAVCAAIAVAIAVAAICMINEFFPSDPKQKAFDYVRDNKDELNDYIEQLILEHGNPDGDYYASFSDEYDGFKVTLWKRNHLIEFEKWGSGLVTNSTYRGFYYSPNDTLMGFQNTQMAFEPDGDGYICKYTYGSIDYEYTEKITDNWYWFEIQF